MLLYRNEKSVFIGHNSKNGIIFIHKRKKGENDEIKRVIIDRWLKKGKILTKEIGLDNEVDSAMVLEAIDIENWSRKNQLILTSFYALHDLPEKSWKIFS